MKIFDSGEHWAGKVNFIDDNNVLLGFDFNSCCCEHFDWFIADTPSLTTEKKGYDGPALDGWNFDPTYFREESAFTEGDSTWPALDSGGMAIFRIVNGDQEKFIHLFNAHNGYYSHGFTFENVGGEKIKDGSL